MLSRKPSPILLIITVILILFGLFMVTSAGTVISQEKFDQSLYFVKNQALKGLLPGVALGIFFFLLPYQYLRKYSKLIFAACLLLMGLVFIPGLGVKLGGATRWIGLGGINFQPSELFKIGFVIYLAAFLEKSAHEMRRQPHSRLIPFLIILALVGALIIPQPDIGTLGIFVMTAVIMYFAAGAPLAHIFFLSGLGFGALVLFIKIFPHASQRFQVFLSSQTDTAGIGYQMNQGLIALGSGGIMGQGLAQGRQKFLYLPQPVGDSIFAVIGEELGFLGTLFLTTLFIVFAIHGLKVARNAPDDFSKFLVIGLTSLIVIQAFINIMAVIGLIPLTGITLPFISYGGTSLAVSMAAVGIILNISRYSKA